MAEHRTADQKAHADGGVTATNHGETILFEPFVDHAPAVFSPNMGGAPIGTDLTALK